MKRLSTNILDGKNANESGGCGKNEEESSVKENMESSQEVSTEICEYEHVDSNTVDESLQLTIPQLIISFCRSDCNDNLPMQLKQEQISPVAVNCDNDLPGGKESEAWNKGCLAQSCSDVTNKNDIPITSIEARSTHALSAGYPRECEEPRPGYEGVKDVVPLKQVFPDSHLPAVSVGKVTHVTAAAEQNNDKDEENTDNQVNNTM